MEHNIGKQKRDALLNAKKNGWDRVDAAAEGADSFFPNLDKLPGWTVRAVSEPVTENGLTYRFYDYVNTKLCD